MKKKQDKSKYIVEFLKCKNDFLYFCKKYIILELPGGDVNLSPYDRQMDLIRLIDMYHFIICLKSRQIGISTIIQAYACWLLVFHRNVVLGIISKDGDEATAFARFIAFFIDRLPIWMKPKFKKRNEQTFQLDNGGKCFSATVNPIEPSKTLRGKAITFLICDEAAFVSNMDKAWTGLVPALATSQKAARAKGVPYGTLIISTPNGVTGIGKWFYERYQKALAGDDIFKEMTIHWKEIKELEEDPDWYQTQTRMFDSEKQILQELELQFLGSEGSFFDENTIKILQENTKDIEPANKYKIFNGEVWEFKKPEPGRSYITGVDTAPENGEDKSALVVFDYETMELVYTYVCKCQIVDYLKIIRSVCINYPGIVIVENNSYGNQIIEDLNNSDFSSQLYKEKRGEKLIPGISTNIKTRPLMIEALYTFVTQYPETIKCRRTVLEMIGLERKPNGRVEAGKGGHDDLAMASAFCYYVRQYDPPLLLCKGSEEYSNLFDIMNFNKDHHITDLEQFNLRKVISNELNEGNKISFVDVFNIINE